LSSLGVVIPTRNRVGLLARAVASVPEDVEIAIIDDASTDETPKLCRHLARTRIIYRRLRHCRGPCYARNVGVDVMRSDLILFLDDDDTLLPGGAAHIARVAAKFPDELLYFHNCVHSDGKVSIGHAKGSTKISYQEWLARYLDYELKPVARREVFDCFRFEDTGAGGEGLLWGKIVRRSGAVVSGTPVVFYDLTGENRLTTPAVLLARARANAFIANRWLEEFGDDVRDAAPDKWRASIRAAVVYNLLASHRDRARSLLRAHRQSLSLIHRALLRAAVVMPRGVVEFGFVLQRRDGKLLLTRLTEWARSWTAGSH
jgi:glycosyltransferase involved in cell wall biosynthesis